MPAPVPRGHPLRRLLCDLTERNFAVHLGWTDPEVIRYVGELLTDFVHVDHLYRIVAEFQHGAYAELAPLFRKLAENFELCVFGLGYVRADLDRLRDPRFQAVKGRLLGEAPG
jgi:hypothetical protein